MDFPESDEHIGFESNESNADAPYANTNSEEAAQKEHVLKKILMPDARMRLGNIRMVKPELANMVEQQLISMVSQGRIQSQLTDEQLKQILSSLQQPKRDFKINRV